MDLRLHRVPVSATAAVPLARPPLDHRGGVPVPDGSGSWRTQLLMQDKETVHHVLEVVELGISGSKSQSKVSDVPQLKAEKELKPSSLRVRDAAEALLSCMMDHVGYFPKMAGPETLSSLLDEEALLKFGNADATPSLPEAVGKHFRYFVSQSSAVIAVLEQNLGNDQGRCIKFKSSHLDIQ
ncbi:hypothetical protein HPB51_023987 [Rhipicephalus microplus]|uniref:Uncharacterized protein n=1 Tax=Rhipicephalus microplus TaxID=6941 RepID=A0A9J6ECZ0_RHIMP|nr:hypothetical protein HPB51_023987 [Rhipicephalus microplus]